jgi:hypothetical protein
MGRRMTQTLRPYQQRGVAEIGANFAGAARQIFAVLSALEVFRARAEARAHLYAAGELELHETVDVLQDAAERTGLVTSLGQDAVQALMAAAFANGAAASNPVTVLETGDDYDGLSCKIHQHVAQSTLDTAEYLVRHNDPARFERWLLEHPARERAAIVSHIRAKP